MTFKQRIIITSGIFGGITMILFLVLIFPLLRSISQQSKELKDAKKELLIFEEEAKNFAENTNLYESVKPNLDKAEALLIEPEAPVELITFWERTATDLGIEIDISPFLVTKSQNDHWDVMGFKVNIMGSPVQFMKFLKKLELAPYLVEVQNLNAKRFTEEELRAPRYKGFMPGDASITLLVKIFTK